MPEPIKRGQRYMPGLDGLRAVAVIGVILYHLGFSWIPGGLLGVGVFFTLSGYLITDILLSQVDSGGVKLKEFWLARARRLFPALFVVLVVVMAWVTLIGPHQSPDFRGAVGSAAFYFNNWFLIFHDVSYFAQFGTPDPLNHLWSLSVEEQFYILWPLMIIGGVALIKEAPSAGGTRVRLAAVTVGLTLISAIEMAILYEPGIDPSRVYYGTDTRAQELLLGAALAMVWPSRRLRANIRPQARKTIDAAGVLGLLVIALMFWQSEEFSPFLYRGGFLLLSIATVLAVAAMAHPASKLGPIVGCRPMRWIGERSYGIYLWHFPIIVLTSPEGSLQQGVDIPRAILQTAATFAVAALSWKYIENPIRHGALKRGYDQWRAGRWRRERVPNRFWAGLGTSVVILLVAFVGFAGAGTSEDDSDTPGNLTVAETMTADPTGEINANRTTCDEVVHVGDSTSEGLVSTEYLPDPADLIAAQYARVGATTQHLEVSGARSIYETFEGQPNAETVAQAWKDEGFDGCWVLALGTNETANVSAGSTVTLDQRIDSMMRVADGDPVLWVNVKSMVPNGPYASTNMEEWNEALLDACETYPNMRVYDWADDVRDVWFVEDGIHFTSEGYAARGRFIADALLEAFPAGGEVDLPEGEDCLINPEDTKAPKPERAGGGTQTAPATDETATTVAPS